MKMVIEYGYTSFTKYGEELCGDNVAVTRKNGYTTLVLADGLGSGVRANILSTLTSKILMTLISNNIPLEDCVETIIETLPVLKQRGVAYSTFSVIYLNNEGKGFLFEFDNPRYILIRNGKYFELESKELYILEKKIYVTELELLKDDTIILMSDGVPYAGTGITLNYGWDRNDIISYLEENLNPKMSARNAASILASASEELYLHKPFDDTTVAAIKFREDVTASLLIGPPANYDNEDKYVADFLANDGYKIICGGTTAKIISTRLGLDIEVDNEIVDKDVPPISHLEGFDLVTEGVLTLKKVLELAEEYVKINSTKSKTFDQKDGASRICDYIFEKSTTIHFYVGQAVNEAYKNLNIDSMLKFKLVEKLAEILKSIGKEVTIEYY